MDERRRREMHLERRDGELGNGCVRGPRHLNELGRDFWKQSFRIAVTWDGNQPGTLIRRHRRGRPCGLGDAPRRDTAQAGRAATARRTTQSGLTYPSVAKNK